MDMIANMARKRKEAKDATNSGETSETPPLENSSLPKIHHSLTQDPNLQFKIPFDPSQLLNLNFGHLKEVIEEIIKSLNRQQGQLLNLQTANFKAISGLADFKKELKPDLDKLMEVIIVSDQHSQQLSQISRDVENFALNQQLGKRQIGSCIENIMELEEKVTTQGKDQISLKESNNSLENSIDQLHTLINSLNMKQSTGGDNSNFDLKFESLNKKLADLEYQLSQNKRAQIEIPNSTANLKDGDQNQTANLKDGDLNIIFAELAKFKKEIQEKYVTRKDFDKLGLQVDKNIKELKAQENFIQDLDQLTKSTKEKQDEHTVFLDKHEVDIEELKKKIENKVEYEMFDDELNNLRLLIGGGAQAPNGQVSIDSTSGLPQPKLGSRLSSKELALIKAILEKFPALEDKVTKIIADLKKLDIEKLKQAVASLDKKKADRDWVLKLVDQLNNGEGQTQIIKRKTTDNLKQYDPEDYEMKQLKARVDDVQQLQEEQDAAMICVFDKIEKLKRMISSKNNNYNNASNQLLDVNQNKEDQVDNDEKDDLLSQLINDFNEFKKKVEFEIKQLQLTKADISSLQDLEDALLQKVNAILAEFSKRFQDRESTKQSFKQFEKHIKTFVETSNQNSPRQDEDTAMLTKKPLGGYSCASCEKDLVNLEMRQSQYQTWNRLPNRGNQERIAKMGPGFSKMLAMMRPSDAGMNQTMTNFNTNSKMGTARDQLDEVAEDTQPKPHRGQSPQVIRPFGTMGPETGFFPGSKRNLKKKINLTSTMKANTVHNSGDELVKDHMFHDAKFFPVIGKRNNALNETANP